MQADLVATLEAGATLVTPNRRLAQHLKREFDVAQQASGRSVWPTPDVLPFSAFIDRSYDEATLARSRGFTAPASNNALPSLLSSAQEVALWEETVRRSDAARGLLSLAQTAAQCRDAWQLAHAWRLMPRLRTAPLQEDVKVFLDWAGRYESTSRQAGYTDSARSADLFAAHLAKPGIKKPRTLIVYGFAITTPQHDELLKAFSDAGTDVQHLSRDARRSAQQSLAFASTSEEISACAKWARTRLEANASARIGIVVPDLGKRRQHLVRILTAILAPAHGLPGAAPHALPFNVSLGDALSTYALVHDALMVLDVARGQSTDFEIFSAFIRSPFIAGAEKEMAQRAMLDLELRKTCSALLTFDSLQRNVLRISSRELSHAACPGLIARLKRLSEQLRPLRQQRKPPAAWSADFAALLAAIGFPGERTPDTAEYQVLAKFRAALATLATLDPIAPRMRYDEALARLTRIAADTMFQPEAPDAPIQILGVLESAGLEFDHLWVMGLTEEAWPMAARPNPFLPVALQRAAGVPESSAALSLNLDRSITQGWLNAADEVVFSRPLRDADRELLPSPLIAAIPQCDANALEAQDWDLYRDLLHASRRIERLTDDHAPPLQNEDVGSAGAGLFRDQAACPFRAMARYRLAAETPAAPAPGLDAAQRGTLLHAVLAAAWTEIRTKARLDAMSGAEIDALLSSATKKALAQLRSRGLEALDGRFADLEQERLQRLVKMWLDFERTREDFEVIHCEQKREATAGDVRVNVKLDRMDRLADGSHAIIDYKSGKAHASSWLGTRPDEPQLPLYLLAAQEDIAALAFARVKLGKDFGFDGIGRSDALMPRVVTIDKRRGAAAKEYASWEQVVTGWRRELDALGHGFASGQAGVDPKHGTQTCAQCDLHTLCRINESSPPFIESDDTGAAGVAELDDE